MQNEERIHVLENQVRTLKRSVYGFGGLLCAVVAGFAMSIQNVPELIQAKKFEVLNGEGMAVASIYGYMGGGMLSISNKDGKVVAGLGADHVNGGSMAGGGVLGINNKDGKIVAGIFANEDGGVMRVLNNEFLEVARISATPHGGALDIKNKGGQNSVALGTQEGSYGVLKTFNPKGEVTSQSP